jgi:hypothetical protein
MTYDPVDANDDGIVESDVDNESVSTEVVNVGESRIQQQTETIDDDEALRFGDIDAPAELFRIVQGASQTEWALLFHNFGNATVVSSGGDFANESPGTLGGTTGTDGLLNYSADGNDIYLENRTGSSGSYTIIDIGRR